MGFPPHSTPPSNRRSYCHPWQSVSDFCCPWETASKAHHTSCHPERPPWSTDSAQVCCQHPQPSVSLFPLSFVCGGHMCVYACLHGMGTGCVEVCVCVCACESLRLMLGSTPLLPHLYSLKRGFSVKPQLAHTASLAGQRALSIPDSARRDRNYR